MQLIYNYFKTDDQLSSNFHRFVYFVHMLRYTIHQVRGLVFDNYQRCRVSFSRKYWLTNFFAKLSGATSRNNVNFMECWLARFYLCLAGMGLTGFMK